MSIRVFLADDHPVVREGIKAVIQKEGADIEVVEEAADGKEVLEKAGKQPIDIYILDVAMPSLNGIETAERLKKKDPGAKVIMLSFHDEKSFIEKALETGARGYILKESAIEEIVQAIREVSEGGYFLSRGISKYLVKAFLDKRHQHKKRKNILTGREREILQLIGEGFTDKDIAKRLCRSFNTVHVHRKNIMVKLDMHTQAELIRYALKEGISQL